MTTLPRRNTPLHVPSVLPTVRCVVTSGADVRAVRRRRTRCPRGPGAPPSAPPSRRTPAGAVAPRASSRSTSARDPGRRSPGGSPAPTCRSMCDAVLDGLRLRHLLEEQPRAGAVRVDDRGPVVPVLLGDAPLAQERLPGVVARRWRLDDVAQRRGPELSLGTRIGAVEHHLDLASPSVSSIRSAGGPHAAQLLLQLADLVAQPGGELELQLGGGRVHLVGELLDQVGEVGRGHAGQLGGVLAGVLRPQAGHRRLAAGLLPAAAAEQLLGVGVLAGEQLGDVG